MTHDYKRHGTTTLFDRPQRARRRNRDRPAACSATATANSYAFSMPVEPQVPAEKPIHVVLDKLCHPPSIQKCWPGCRAIRAGRLPRTHDLGLGGLNAVENFFSKMDPPNASAAASSARFADLKAAINAYLAEHNANPKPFVWTKSADAILAKLDRLAVSSV